MVGRVAVIGAGVMGHGIAQLFAQAGSEVRLCDLDTRRLAVGIRSVEDSLALLEEEQVLSRSECLEARARIEPTIDRDAALVGAEVVVECIPELLEEKRALFADVERLVADEALILSNTSTMRITALAERARRPERFAIAHFFNPAQLVPLVEVLPHPLMPRPVAEGVMETMRRIGKHPVLLRRELPGFIANRLQAALAREAFHLLEEGVASARDIDAVVTEGPGFRWPFVGPVEIADLGGLDTWARVLDGLCPELSGARQAPRLIREAVERGDLGAKTGKGICDYQDLPVSERLRERDRFLIRLAMLKAR
jgi:3-hydroxybutyryl-CoA dehydrogenase